MKPYATRSTRSVSSHPAAALHGVSGAFLAFGVEGEAVSCCHCQAAAFRVTVETLSTGLLHRKKASQSSEITEAETLTGILEPRCWGFGLNACGGSVPGD
jgi:hypothetical protein